MRAEIINQRNTKRGSSFYTTWIQSNAFNSINSPPDSGAVRGLELEDHGEQGGVDVPRTKTGYAAYMCTVWSVYQMLAKMKEMMERLATLHTTPISTSRSQVVRCAHCTDQNSRQPF